MARRRKRRRWVPAPWVWWSELDEDYRRRALIGGTVLTLAVSTLLIASYGIERLDSHVRAMALEQHPAAEVVYVDLPEELAPFALDDLQAALFDLQEARWTDPGLCRLMTARLGAVGWVERIVHVRRTSEAQFNVSAVYRYPVAMVQQGTEFLLVDARGVRLPGSYRYDSRWPLIQGALAPAPQPGEVWPGEDVRSGLAVLARVRQEPFADQITAVLVDNYSGRVDAYRSHLQLATDRSGGRIAWGSAIGQELEENTVEQKLALLRANYRETGRVDAHHPQIDISTFPDRFTVPG